jgi:hypothetical protein
MHSSPRPRLLYRLSRSQVLMAPEIRLSYPSPQPVLLFVWPAGARRSALMR